MITAAKHHPRAYFHMLPQDKIIWEKFLYTFEDAFDEFHYDIKIGPVHPSLEELPQNIRELAHLIYRLRIDVVAYKDSQPTLIEVKPNAGLSALGQLLAYEFYWNLEDKSPQSPNLAVVTDNARTYMPELWEFWSIEWYVV